MNIKKIIFLAIFIVFFSFFLLNYTYFEIKTKYKDLEQVKFGTWYEEIIINGSWLIYNKKIFNDKNLTREKVYVDNLNFSDKIYFSWNNHVKNISNNQIIINISKWWLYFFDLYDITKNYKILSNGFKITPLSPWKIYIDNRSNNIWIFSFDSIFDISLLDWKKEVTSLSMYPRMFFWFNSFRNKFLVNADILRLETITKIFYFKDEFLIEKKLSDIFKTSLGLNQESYNFLSLILSKTFSHNLIDMNDEENISLIHTKEIWWIDYINKYFYFLFNDNKKQAYYKNQIISLLNQWVNNDVIDKDEIMNLLDLLKSLDNNEYNNFKLVLYYYYDLFLKLNSTKYISKVFSLSEIIIYSNWDFKKELLQSSFFLNKIYYMINFKKADNTFLPDNLLIFLKQYFVENAILLDDKNNISIKNNFKILKLEYLSFFIKNIIIYNFDFSDSNKLESITNILNIYNNLNLVINDKKYNLNSERILVENISIINKIMKEIRDKFFLKELNSQGLLVLSENISVNEKSLSNLDYLFKRFFDFYDNNNSNLSQKNLYLNSEYANVRNKYKEYYDALNNYQQYLINYNKSTSQIFEIQTVAEKTQDIFLSNELLITYLSKFQWVDVSSLESEIVNWEFYKIKKLFVNWTSFSFNLYPKNNYRIDNINIDWNDLNKSYELSYIEKELEKKKETASKENINKYDFSYFFINTFLKINQNVVVSNNTEKNPKEEFLEDRIVWIFKRDKLLWKRWEFSILKNYLELKYKNIIVEFIDEIYYISFKNIILRTSINLGDEWKNIIWELNADYVFNEKDHYFKNISIKFYDPDKYNDTKEYLFNWNSLKINKNVNIVDFKTEIDSIIKEHFNNNL